MKAFLMYMKKNRPEIEGVCLYINNEAMVMLQNGSIVPKRECALPKEKIFTFFDNSHTIGADIPQSLGGKAICTLSENLFHKDLSQGVYRMRGVVHQQNVYYVGTEECS